MNIDHTYMESTFTALAMLGAWDDCRPSLQELYARCTAWLERHGLATVPRDAFARLLEREFQGFVPPDGYA